MGTRSDAKKDYEIELESILERKKIELDLIDQARYILEKQAKEIIPEIKKERDLCICQIENELKLFENLRGHHIKMIDTFQAENRELLQHMDILNREVQQEFLKYVEIIGYNIVNHPHNFITVCTTCHTKIHKDPKAHETRLKLLAIKNTKSWNNKQRKMEDFLPDINEVSAELSEVKEKLNQLNFGLEAKDKIIEILSTSNQNLTDDLDPLRESHNILTDEIKNYKNRLSEKENELEMVKKQLITFLKSTMLKTEFEDKKEEEVEVEDLWQEQGEIHRESIIPNDKETPEKRKPIKKACKLRELLNSLEEESSIAKKKIPKLILKLDKLESKKKTTLHYWNYDRGYMICNKDKIEFQSILTKPVLTYTEDIGLTLYSEEDRHEYGRRVGKNQRYGKFETFEDLERILEIAYDAAVRNKNINHEIVIDDD